MTGKDVPPRLPMVAGDILSRVGDLPPLAPEAFAGLARLGQRWILYDPDGEEIPVEGFGLFGAFSPSPTAKLSRPRSPPSPTSLANV